jgi:hypothetical protein
MKSWFFTSRAVSAIALAAAVVFMSKVPAPPSAEDSAGLTVVLGGAMVLLCIIGFFRLGKNDEKGAGFVSLSFAAILPYTQWVPGNLSTMFLWTALAVVLFGEAVHARLGVARWGVQHMLALALACLFAVSGFLFFMVVASSGPYLLPIAAGFGLGLLSIAVGHDHYLASRSMNAVAT